MKKGRPTGKGIRTGEAETAYFAAYLKLKMQGRTHSEAIDTLTSDFKNTAIKFFSKTCTREVCQQCGEGKCGTRFFLICKQVGAERIEQIVKRKKKVISDMRLKAEKRRAEWKEQFQTPRKVIPKNIEYRSESDDES